MKFRKVFFIYFLSLAVFIFIAFELNLWQADQQLRSVMSYYIQKNLEKGDFEAAVVIKDLTKRRLGDFLRRPIYVSLNENQSFPAASLIKLPLMACCFKAEREGKININDTYVLKKSDITGGSGVLKAKKAGSEFSLLELIELMISQSDNTASNIFIKKLGFEYLNACFKDLGLKHTVVNRTVMDLNSRKKGIENLTSASDLSYLYEAIYKKDLVDAEACETMLKFLSNQKVKNRLPRYLPKDITIAHKTGTIRGIVHDAGIVFSPKRDYIICVLTKGSKGYTLPKDFIAEVSEFVYYLLAYGN
ncbi:MAG: serine hydrolase [Candidatus Omnitrophica bacterium]|nr:serine hydrolase [Candidatus Omnitrophota bacterium]